MDYKIYNYLKFGSLFFFLNKKKIKNFFKDIKNYLKFKVNNTKTQKHY